MKKLRWQLIIIFLTGLVVGVLLLAEQPQASPLLAPKPIQGGIYAEALVGSLQRLNPLLAASNSVDRDVSRLLFSGLVRFDTRGVAQPELAESWGVSRDGMIYNFTLRSGLRWHDGEPLTARDVVFTIELMREGEGVIPEDLRQLWQQIEITALSDTALQFRLPDPFAPFLDYLTFGILPQHLLGGLYFDELVNDPFNLAPIGNGMYRFDRLLVEEDRIVGVVLTAFEGYYGEPPFLQQVVFRYYPDSVSALRAYQEGVVQGIGNVTPDILTGALAEPNLAIYSGRKPELALILFNLKNPETAFLGEIEVRKALLMGLNRQWMIDRVLKGQAIVATGP
ncbi:MAG: ABC transporter substrate-binding protein, partial [Anaerolineaceae bacterium]|nr:ABC transporter substrate-binding protein [Anaerolineaceae bacterium]